MSFAADAVADLIAPPPKAAAPKPAPADRPEPRFDDHLDNAAQADEAPPEEPTPTSASAPTEEATPTTTPEPKDAKAQTAAQTPATLLVQLIAAEPPTQTAKSEPEPAPPVAPTNVAPPEAPIVVAAQTPTPNTTAAKKSAQRDQNAKSVDADAVQAAPDATAAQTPEAIAAPAPVQTAAPTPPSTEQTSNAETAPVGAANREPTERAPKADPNAGLKTQAPSQKETAPTAPASDAPKQSDAKAAVASARDNAAPAKAADVSPQAQLPAPAPAMAAAPIQAPAPLQHAAAEQAGLRVAPAASQVAREIVRRFDGDNTSFQIRLDPPELGRVDVRLEVSRDHRVTATVSADNPQALTELARHARDLEQTLQSAGLELADNGLSFDLRQGGEGRSNTNNDRAPSSGGRGDDANLEQLAAARPLGFESWRGVRVDMMV